MGYLVVFASIVCLRFLFPRNTKKDRLSFSVISCLFLIFFAALRSPTVGRDTASFIDVFQKIAGRGILDVLRYSSWTEPGFRLFCAFLGIFTHNGQWLIAVTSIFIQTSVSRFLYRHVRNIYLGFFLYLTTMLYPFGFSMMRQMLAISVLLYAYDFFQRKQWVRYEALVLIAAMFHTSAALFSLCPLLLLIPVNRKSLKFLLPGTAVLSLLAFLSVKPIIRIIQKLIPRYAEYEPTTFAALYCFLAVFACVTAFGVFRLYYGRERQAEEEKCFFDERGFLTLMMLIGCIVAAAMTRFGELQRIFNYFEVLYVLWLPLCLPPSPYDGEKHRLLFRPEMLFTVLGATAYFSVLLFFRSGLWYDAMPYMFFF